MREIDVLRDLLARMEYYEISTIVHVRGRFYDVTMQGQLHRALLLDHSFSYYELRYHVGRVKPTLIICHVHDCVLPIAALSLRDSRIHNPYNLPAGIEDVEQQRRTKTGSRVLLGMLLSGMQRGYDIIEKEGFPKATRNRYLARIEALGKRRRGRPVGSMHKQDSETAKKKGNK